jgi:cellulose biosynthesis protein BcsQ
MNGVEGVLTASDVVVCCGSGGVGKTTTAAVLGLRAARMGRRVVVVTIDPARRLADALGLAAEAHDDLREYGIAPDLRSLHQERTRLIDCRARHRIALFFIHGHRFAGQHRLVESAATFRNRSVHRHLFAGAHAQAVALGDLV